VVKYLIDTSIWVDLYEDRKGYRNEPLGDFAFTLLAWIKVQKHRIVITDFLIRELEVLYSMEEIKGLFKPFEDIIDKVVSTSKQRAEAKRIAVKRNIPPGDALYAIIARDHDLILITRDNHFKELKDISPHLKPEDVI